MRTTATPREVENLLERLAPVREQMRRRRPPMTAAEVDERVVAIVRQHFEVVDDCLACDRPVRRCDPRAQDTEGRLVHLACRREAP